MTARPMLRAARPRAARLEQADLNLLVPLAALLQERHVSRAAQRTHLSQPAMSRSLARLRVTLGDELLVRGIGGYRLTPHAERLQRQLATVLPSLEALLSREGFDPETAQEAFRVAGTDYIATVFGTALARRVLASSPGSSLTFTAWHGSAVEDLETGKVDLAVLGSAPPRRLRSRPLFADPLLCVMDAGHPLARSQQLTLEQYLACAHVIVDVTDEGQNAVDRHLLALGHARAPSLTVPYHSAAAAAVAGTRLVATLPECLARSHRRDPALRMVTPPAEVKPTLHFMAWHPRLEDDPAQQWLRGRLAESVEAVGAHDAGAGVTLRDASHVA